MRMHFAKLDSTLSSQHAGKTKGRGVRLFNCVVDMKHFDKRRIFGGHGPWEKCNGDSLCMSAKENQEFLESGLSGEPLMLRALH